MSYLKLERKNQPDTTVKTGQVMMTPSVSEDYWEYRVGLTESQAVIGFPKFMTIGIGFAVEEDWNTNLPYLCTTEEIRQHIWHNRGDETITKEMVDEAIQLIREAAAEDKGEDLAAEEAAFTERKAGR